MKFEDMDEDKDDVGLKELVFWKFCWWLKLNGVQFWGGEVDSQ